MQGFLAPRGDGSHQVTTVTPGAPDPWVPPVDRMRDGKGHAGVIHREIPLVTIQTSWSVDDMRGALAALVQGQFELPSQLVDAVLGDDRVQATMGSRCGGFLGRPVRHEASDLPKVSGSKAAKACLDAWLDIWPTTLTESVLSEIQTWAIMLGFAPCQILWDTSGEYWVPHLRPWHPRYTYYQWIDRAYIAVSQDGQYPITAGDGHWLLHAPYGEYRGWMRGAVRALAQPWLIRAFAYRDWARYSERHGMPMILAKTPSAGDKDDIERFRTSLASLGQESVVELPQGVEQQFSFDLQYLEAKDNAHQAFAELIDRCERSMVLAILWQNLTTEVKEGSFAAARVHADVRQSALEYDARALSYTLYTQLARPFAALNFGDADLAPRTSWDITPYEDAQTAAVTAQQVSQTVSALATAGWTSQDIPALFETFGLKFGAGKWTKGGTP